MKKSYEVQLVSATKGNRQFFQLLDNDKGILEHQRIVRVINRYNSYFSNIEKYILKDSISYVEVLRFVDSLDRALRKLGENPLEFSKEASDIIKQKQYAINEHKTAGQTIKKFDNRWSNEVDEFERILNNEITRPLIGQQIQASFYLAKMKRAANFSVPGAGKTAMMYGAYAYLSSEEINQVERILVVCPLNAFEAWRTEYLKVFVDKRQLKFMNLRDKRYNDYGNIRFDWGASNVIVINYESLKPRVKVLNELIDAKTMIVFDEVHRVKGIGGQRARAALKLGNQAQYRYVLTGTPIPNTYKDIYNFLHLLYKDEYNGFFGWEVNELENPNAKKVNEKLYPFFWRTNKKDLNIPKAEPDNRIVTKPTEQQLNLAKAIYENESNILAIYIRLLQASTNPALLLDKINYYDLGFLEDEVDLTQFNALNDEESEKARILSYKKFDVKNMISNKFEKGIELIMDLVNEGKKVLVWGMFVNTMHKIVKRLKTNGVSVNLIYGETDREERVELINEFRDGNIQVLVTNPNTLGESVSLHQTVHDAVYFEYNFNLTFMLQSRDRIHRLGLPKDQYTRYYYLMNEGDRTEGGFIDKRVYKRLKEKEEVMLKAIDGEMLFPEITDDYLEDVKRIIEG